jgi:hypothetical protein
LGHNSLSKNRNQPPDRLVSTLRKREGDLCFFRFRFTTLTFTTPFAAWNILGGEERSCGVRGPWLVSRGRKNRAYIWCSWEEEEDPVCWFLEEGRTEPIFGVHGRRRRRTLEDEEQML